METEKTGLISFLSFFGNMFKIKKDTLEHILLACKNVYPREFLAMLGSTKKDNVIDEYVMLPGESGDSAAFIYLNTKPMDKGILGSVHSHPSPSNKPSSGDLSSFPKYGRIHLIISYPYTMKDVAMYDSFGKELEFEIVE